MNTTLQSASRPTRGLSIGRRIASVLEELRVRRAAQSVFAQQIAAYPVARSVATPVLFD